MMVTSAFTSQGCTAGPWGSCPKSRKSQHEWWDEHSITCQGNSEGGPGQAAGKEPEDITLVKHRVIVLQPRNTQRLSEVPNPGSLPHRELVVTTHTLKHGANRDFLSVLESTHSSTTGHELKAVSLEPFLSRNTTAIRGLGSFGTNSLFCSYGVSSSCLQSQTFTSNWRNLSHISWFSIAAALCCWRSWISPLKH